MLNHFLFGIIWIRCCHSAIASQRNGSCCLEWHNDVIICSMSGNENGDVSSWNFKKKEPTRTRENIWQLGYFPSDDDYDDRPKRSQTENFHPKLMNKRGDEDRNKWNSCWWMPSLERRRLKWRWKSILIWRNKQIQAVQSSNVRRFFCRPIPRLVYEPHCREFMTHGECASVRFTCDRNTSAVDADDSDADIDSYAWRNPTKTFIPFSIISFALTKINWKLIQYFSFCSTFR